MNQPYRVRCRLNAVRAPDGTWSGQLYDANNGSEIGVLAVLHRKESVEALRAFGDSLGLRIEEVTISPDSDPAAP